VTLSAALLARRPAETLKVSFLAGAPPAQTHTEIGPALWEVLAAAGIRPTLNTWVAAVSDDNYMATVTPAEQFAGGRPLQLSLNEDGVAPPQPRLVTDGDVKGGRYYRMSSTSTSAPRPLTKDQELTRASVSALIAARLPASSGGSW
jgi:hypothetical protein